MKTTTALILAIVLLAPSLGRAQATPSGQRRDRARTFLVIRLAEELHLSDEKALQVSAVMRASDDRRRELSQQRDQVEAQIRTALDRTPQDDAELSKLIAQANEIDQKHSQIAESSYLDVQKLLTVEQQARLVLFRPQLRRQVRGAIRQRLEGERKGGPGSGSPK